VGQTRPSSERCWMEQAS